MFFNPRNSSSNVFLWSAGTLWDGALVTWVAYVSNWKVVPYTWWGAPSCQLWFYFYYVWANCRVYNCLLFVLWVVIYMSLQWPILCSSFFLLEPVWRCRLTPPVQGPQEFWITFCSFCIYGVDPVVFFCMILQIATQCLLFSSPSPWILSKGRGYLRIYIPTGISWCSHPAPKVIIWELFPILCCCTGNKNDFN